MFLIPRHSLQGYYDKEQILQLASIAFAGGQPDFNEVDKIEKMLAGKIGCRYSVLMSSARSALYNYLKASGQIESVCIQPYTCKIIPDAIVDAKKKMIFVDIELETFALSANSIPRDQKIDAIVITHMFGMPSRDTKEILETARKRGWTVIEDFAQGYGGSVDGKRVGTLGDVGILSFDFTKNVPLGAGGALVTNNHDIYVKMKELQSTFRPYNAGELRKRLMLLTATWASTQNHSLFKIARSLRGGLQEKDKEITMPSDPNKRMALYSYAFPYQLAANMEKMINKEDKINEVRRRNAGIYSRELNDVPGLVLPLYHENGGTKNIFLRYPLLVTGKSVSSVRARLEMEGIDTGDWFCDNLVDEYTIEQDRHFPNNDKACATILNLPVHIGVTNKNVEKVCDAVKNVMTTP